MGSLTNVSAALLIVLTLITSPFTVAGSTGSSPMALHGPIAVTMDDCEDVKFWATAMDRCRERHGQPNIDFPWTSDFLTFLISFAQTSESEKETYMKQFGQLTEAYRCYHHTYRYCINLFLGDEAFANDEEYILYFQDIHLYIPDLDLVGTALSDIYRLRDEHWSCVSHRPLRCGLERLLNVRLLVELVLRGQPLNVKPHACRAFSIFRLCTEEGLKNCPPNQQALVSRVVDHLTPPACIRHGFAEIDQNHTEKDPETIHNEF